MGLSEDLRRIAEAAVPFAGAGEELSGIVPAEPADGERAYLCAFSNGGTGTSWIILDDSGRAVQARERVRDVVSIAVMCELAEEIAGGGDLDELRVATPERLDAVGAATGAGSSFAEAMQHAVAIVERLRGDVERNYKRELR